MKFKHARTVTELQEQTSDYYMELQSREYLRIPEWGVADVDADVEQLGLSGSPTKVKKIDNVVFAAKEAKRLSSEDTDIEWLIKELMANHTIG